MANLTATTAQTFGRTCQEQVSSWAMNFKLPVTVGQVIYPCAMVGLSSAAGTVIRGGGVIATFNGGIRGVARRQLGDLANPSVAGNLCDFRQGIFRMTNGSAITAASRGLVCYADDDNTVSLTNTNVTAGIIIDVDTIGVWVAIGVDLRTP